MKSNSQIDFGITDLFFAFFFVRHGSSLKFTKIWNKRLPHCNGLWPSREPRRLRSRFIWNVRINCVKLKRVFSAPLLKTYTPNNVHSITYHDNNVQSPFKIYLIIALNKHWAIFHVLELSSTNQIPFCQIRLRSISCHFPVNKLHLITYSHHIVQPHWKNSGGTKCYW